MKKTVKKVNKKTLNNKDRVVTIGILEKKLDERFVTNEKFDRAMKNIDERFVTNEKFDRAMKNIDERFVTNEKFDRAMKNIDERFEKIDKKFDNKIDGLASTMISSMETMFKEYTLKMKVLLENKKDKDKIYFKDGLETQSYKIQDLEKRVVKIEKKIF